MKSLRLSLLLFAKSLSLNLLIALQLCAAVIFGIMAFGVVEEAYLGYTLTAGLEGAYAYMGKGADVFEDETTLFSQAAASGKIVAGRALDMIINERDPVTNEWLRSQDDRTIKGTLEVWAYDALIGEEIKGQLRAGRWYSDAPQEEGVVNCVVIGQKNTLPIGTELPMGTFTYRATENEDGTFTVDFPLAKAYTFRVVGWLGERAEVFKFTSSGTPMFYSANSFWATADYQEESFFESLVPDRGGPWDEEPDTAGATILCDTAALEMETVDYGMLPPQASNAVFRFADSVGEAEREELLAALSGEAGVVSVERTRENARAEAQAEVAQYMPVLYCFVALAALGALCSGVLNMYRNRQVFFAYKLCGMRFWQGAALVVVFSLIVLAVAAVMALVGWTLLTMLGLLPWGSMHIGADSALFAVLCAAGLFALLAGAGLYILRDYFKEKDGV